MSKVKDMLMDIEHEIVDAIENGSEPNFEEIAKELCVPVSWVEDQYEMMTEGEYDASIL